MDYGYEVYEDKRNFEQKGLTGTVSRYATEKMRYPCYVIGTDNEHPVEKFKIDVLRSMFKTADVYNEEESKRAIALYFAQGDEIARLGQIYPKQVKPFLQLFENCLVTGYFDANTKLIDDYLYVLAE